MKKELLLKKMLLTKNKDLFFECPDYLKEDFDFITDVMKIFSDDFDFIEEIAENYCRFIPRENIEDDPRFIELSILLGRFVPEGNVYYNLYKNRVEVIYNSFLLNLLMIKQHRSDVSELGFSILVGEYGDRDNILKFFAYRIMSEIYNKNPDGTFEDMIHGSFEDFLPIERTGYENFFINYLTNVDYYLGEYVAQNTSILEDFVEDLEYIGDNWEIYQDEVLMQSVELINSWVMDKRLNNVYGDDFDYVQSFKEVVVSKRLGKVFGIDKKEVVMQRGKVVSFFAHIFKKDLGELIDKVFVSCQTLSKLSRLIPASDDGNKKKL